MSGLRRNLLFIAHTFVWVAALGLLLVAPYKLVEAKQPTQTGPDYRFQAQRSQLNQEQYRTRDVELGDFDADGDLDVLLVNETEHPLVLFRNEGGTYREVAELNPGSGLLAANAAWGDADGDGDLDLAVAVRNGRVAHLIFENQNGTLSDTPLKLFESPGGTIDGQSVAWGDFNGDGLLDLVFANGMNAPSNDTSPIRHTHQNYVYENRSVPGQLDFELTFEDQQEVPSYGLTIADLDGDDDLDIVVANGAGNEVPFNNFIYVNNHDGNGNSPISFTVVSVEAIVAATENIPEPAPQTSLSVAHADFNRDGKPDIVFGNYRSPDLLLCNLTPFPAPGEPTQPLQLQTCFNTDEGHGLPGLEGSKTTGVAIADMDGDMNLDLALSLQNQSSLILCGTQGGGSNLTFEICWESHALGTNLASADVAIGDLNSDGRLDLVLGNGGYQFIDQPSYVYHSLQIVFRDNSNASGNPQDADLTSIGGAAAADLDMDGDTDFFIARSQIENSAPEPLGLDDLIYLYDETTGDYEKHVFPFNVYSKTHAVALGNFDNFGPVDIALGGGFRNPIRTMPIQIYRALDSTPGTLPSYELLFSSPEEYVTTSLAWGDMNGDGCLDLAVANLTFAGDGGELGKNRVFLNEACTAPSGQPGNGTFSEVWRSPLSQDSYKVAWGDVDNDGDPDLVVANFNRANELFINEGGQLAAVSAWHPNGAFMSTDLALADFNNDGLLDVVVANGMQFSPQASYVYLNVGGTFSATPYWATAPFPTVNVAVSDVGNDGDMDIAFGNISVNDPALPFTVPNHLYMNNNGVFETEPFAWITNDGNRTQADLLFGELLAADTDNDGDQDLIDLFRGSLAFSARILTNERNDGGQPVLTLNNNPGTPLFSAESHDVAIPFQLSNGRATDRFTVSAFYSLNGGGDWQPIPGEIHEQGTATPWATWLQNDTAYLYRFNTLNLGLFGRHEQFVVRLVATPYLDPAYGLRYIAETPSLALHTAPAANTAPFFVSGYTVHVIDELGQPVPNAIVLHQADQSAPFLPFVRSGQDRNMVDLLASPDVFRTDGQGNLQGRGAFRAGDPLIAFQRADSNDMGGNLQALSPAQGEAASVSLYYTNYDPVTKLINQTVNEAGATTTLTVSGQNKLFLFDIDVSIEWDVSRDEAYLAQLRQHLQQSSRILYDLTNGQMALGHVNIYWNKEYWRGSDVQIYASNRYQPNAALGGVVSRPITLTFAAPGAVAPGIDTLVLPSQAGTLFADTTIPNAITPGQVRMPATWNRFGEPGLEGADDWARTLAHELGHYLLFLPDNYLLADPANNYLLEVDNNTPCRPSAMASAYANPGDPDSELLLDLNTVGCEKVVAQWLTSLSDWELVAEIYGIQANALAEAGPFQLPFPVTFISQISTQSNSNAPVDELFFVRLANGSAETLSPRTVSAYLFRPGERIIDVIALGAPVGNQINARGARIGDELCVYDMSPDNQRSACSIIGVSNTDLQFSGFDWLPTVTITPSAVPEGADLTAIVPVTLDIAIELFGDETIGTNPSVQVQFFTDFISSTIAYASPEITLVPEGGSRYTGVITLDHAPVDSYVRIWLNGDKDSQVMVPVFLGGGWLPDRWVSGPDRWVSGPDRWVSGPDRWVSGAGHSAGWNAPVAAGGGQLTVFNLCGAFGRTPEYSLQALPAVPALPFWLVPVGNAYQISFDNAFTYEHCQATNAATSLLFSYPERDLPNRVWEDRLRIYYLNAGEWQPVSNLSVNPELNLVSGTYVTNTVYVLGMSNEIALQRGWNLVGYPHRRPISVTTLIEPVVADIGAIIGYANRATGFQIYCPHTANGNTPPHRPNAGSGGAASAPSAARAIPKCRPGANDLTELQYGYGYWVYAINDTTLRLPVDLINDPGNQPGAASVAQVMPAFLDGQLTSAEEQTLAGASLVAWIDGRRCGETTITEADGKYRFRLLVPVGESTEQADCGRPGAEVRFTLNGKDLDQTILWDNTRVLEPILAAPEQSGPSTGWHLGAIAALAVVTLLISLKWTIAVLNQRRQRTA